MVHMHHYGNDYLKGGGTRVVSPDEEDALMLKLGKSFERLTAEFHYVTGDRQSCKAEEVGLGRHFGYPEDVIPEYDRICRRAEEVLSSCGVIMVDVYEF